jgi:hypothetical protein
MARQNRGEFEHEERKYKDTGTKETSKKNNMHFIISDEKKREKAYDS